MLTRSFRSSKPFVTFAVCVAIFTNGMLTGSVIPVLPYALSDYVGVPAEDVQRWNSILLALYGGALMPGSLFIGWIGDTIPNRQTPFILGLVLSGASIISFAIGRSLPALLLARVLQGLSAAISFTVGYALLLDAVGEEGIGQAMGYTTMSLNLGLLIGPVIGSTLFEYSGYFQVFIPFFALLGIDVVLRIMIINETRPSIRAILLESGTPPADSAGDAYGTYDPVPALEGRGAAEANTFPKVLSSKSSNSVTETEPLLPVSGPIVLGSSFPTLLCSSRFLVAIVGLFFLNSLTTGLDGVLPVYAYDEFKLNPVQGALLLLLKVVAQLLSPISGALADRIGTKWPATSGFVLMVPSLVLLGMINRDVLWPISKLAVVLLIFGLAMALALPPLMTDITSVIEEIEQASPGIFGPYGAYSQGYGLMNTAFAGGALAGPLFAGFIREWLGWPAMFLVMGVMSSIMLTFVLVMTGGYGFHGDQTASTSSDG